MSLCIVPMTLREANEFVVSFHRHNKQARGCKFAIGVEDDTDFWGVAIVGRPVARGLQDGFTAEVLRTCCRDGAPKGCNSALYAAAWRACRAMGYRRLVTYTLATESGASLRGAGFRTVAELAPRKTAWKGPDRDRDWQPIYGQQKLRWERVVNA